MTPAQIREARAQLGLSPRQFAEMLGYVGEHARIMTYHLEHEPKRRTLGEAQRRLIEAYLAGYRPDDWPSQNVAM